MAMNFKELYHPMRCKALVTLTKNSQISVIHTWNKKKNSFGNKKNLFTSWQSNFNKTVPGSKPGCIYYFLMQKA